MLQVQSPAEAGFFFPHQCDPGVNSVSKDEAIFIMFWDSLGRKEKKKKGTGHHIMLWPTNRSVCHGTTFTDHLRVKGNRVQQKSETEVVSFLYVEKITEAKQTKMVCQGSVNDSNIAL